MNKMKRMLGTVMLVMCLIWGAGMSVSAAYSTLFAFNPPFPNSAQETGLKAKTSNPYVKVKGIECSWAINPDTISTTFCLRNGKNVVSDYVKIRRGNSGKFKYGSSVTKAQLLGYPTDWDFEAYSCSVEWQP